MCSELTRSRGFTYIPPPRPLLARTFMCKKWSAMACYSWGICNEAITNINLFNGIRNEKAKGRTFLLSHCSANKSRYDLLIKSDHIGSYIVQLVLPVLLLKISLI